MAPGQEADGDNLGMYVFSIFHKIMLNVLIRIT